MRRRGKVKGGMEMRKAKERGVMKKRRNPETGKESSVVKRGREKKI